MLIQLARRVIERETSKTIIELNIENMKNELALDFIMTNTRDEIVNFVRMNEEVVKVISDFYDFFKKYQKTGKSH